MLTLYSGEKGGVCMFGQRIYVHEKPEVIRCASPIDFLRFLGLRHASNQQNIIIE